MRRSRSASLLAVIAAMAMVAAGCGRSDRSTTATTARTEEVPVGGTLVVGAEQEPDCVDWIGSCSGSSWGFWSMNVTTMPHAFDVVMRNGSPLYEPSSLLTGAPEVSRGDRPTVTYHINPRAVWSDGTPITSRDFRYTWDQVANGSDVYDRTGYDHITGVDDSRPDTAVVMFKDGYADYKSLFGTQYGIWPAHILTGRDRDRLTANGYTWSGGPWKIERWDKGQQWSLIRNDAFWGPKPKLDKIVFKLISDTSAEFQAFKAGEVMVTYPQPQLDVVDQIAAGLPGTEHKYNADTGNAEALWMNQDRAPFNDKAFRQAIAYSLDRDAVVDRLFGRLGVSRALNTFTAPIVRRFAQLDAFSQFRKDLARVTEIMTGAGWRKGADGLWLKAGRKALFLWKTTAGNKRRELTQQVVQQQLREAGFDVRINNARAGDLFGDILPKGAFQMALYANVLTSPYPSGCNLFCSKNIPTAATRFSGNNWTRTKIPELDPLLQKVEVLLDESAAQEANRRGDRILADNLVSLPLDPLPNILLWNSRVVGPVQDNPVTGPFVYADRWGLKP